MVIWADFRPSLSLWFPSAEAACQAGELCRQRLLENLTWVLREASRACSQGSAQHLGLREANCLLIVHISAIGNAYAVLSNPEKRKQYDQYGDEKLNPARHGHSHADFHRGFEADISPEDLFNMFFGGGFPSSKRIKPRCPERAPALLTVTVL